MPAEIILRHDKTAQLAISRGSPKRPPELALQSIQFCPGRQPPRRQRICDDLAKSAKKERTEIEADFFVPCVRVLCCSASRVREEVAALVTSSAAPLSSATMAPLCGQTAGVVVLSNAQAVP